MYMANQIIVEDDLLDFLTVGNVYHFRFETSIPPTKHWMVFLGAIGNDFHFACCTSKLDKVEKRRTKNKGIVETIVKIPHDKGSMCSILSTDTVVDCNYHIVCDKEFINNLIYLDEFKECGIKIESELFLAIQRGTRISYIARRDIIISWEDESCYYGGQFFIG